MVTQLQCGCRLGEYQCQVAQALWATHNAAYQAKGYGSDEYTLTLNRYLAHVKAKR